MAIFQDENGRPEPPVVTAAKRWFHAVTAHFTFCVCLGAAHCVSLVPCTVLLYLFGKMGGFLHLLGAVVLAGLPGAVWTAIHRMSRQMQFGHPVYLFREFWGYLRQNFRRGWLLGMVLGLLWLLTASPLAAAERYQQPLPVPLVCLMGACAMVLAVVGEYACYQLSRYELTVSAAMKNGILLIFSMGWRSIAVCLAWIALAVGLLLAGQILLPVCLLCGLTVILCMTEQSFFAPRIDTLLTSDRSNEKENET